MSPAHPGGMTGEIQTFDVSERENLNLLQCIAGLLWLLGSIASLERQGLRPEPAPDV